MAVGMGIGVIGTHYILRPLENKIASHAPMAAKFMNLGEILLGGYMAMKAKSPIMKGVGLGVMAGGVFGGLKQVNIYHESPAGMGDYAETMIPLDGQLQRQINGVIRDSEKPTYSSLVAGSNNGIGQTQDLYRSYLLAGTNDDEYGEYLPPKGSING